MSGAAPEARSGAIRAFVALELPEPLRAGLAELMERLRPAVRGIRWVAPESLHITLRFLGWTRAEVLDRLRPALSAAATAAPALDTRVAGLGTFPQRGRARVLWMRLLFPREAFALQEACEQAALGAGFAPEERAFTPHLTLGRWKQPASPPALPEADFGVHRLARLVLYRSRLTPGGSVYTPIENFPLGRR